MNAITTPMMLSPRMVSADTAILPAFFPIPI